MIPSGRTRRIQGREFTFEVLPERPEQPAMLYCESADPTLKPLCEAMNCAWGRGAAAFLESLAARTGQDFEGAAGYDYAPDGVTAYFLDDEASVSDGFFRELALALAEEALALDGVGGYAIPDAPDVRTRLARLKG
jgi:hypothetical protein